jgi:Cu(I)/Ag(I) efflux system membrane fusion protein
MNETKEVYTCPMHPEVVSDKSEKCPKCGMDLVLKKDEEVAQ